MIEINDPVEFREIVDGQPCSLVLAFCTAVHDENCIDLGWRGDGGIRPGVVRNDIPVHHRANVARIGTILGGDGVSPTPQPRQHTQWEKR